MTVLDLDPRDIDRHHSIELHRPDFASDHQVDSLWSYASQPGGWYPTTAIPEPATYLMMLLGFALLFGVHKRAKRVA